MPRDISSEVVSSILQGDDGIQRMREVSALRDRDPLRALDAVISLLGSAEANLATRAGGALSLFRDHIAVRTASLLDHLLHNANPHVRLSCAILLMGVSAPPVTKAYLEAVKDPFDKVAQLACCELGSRGGPDSEGALIRTLSHPSWRVRLEACKALIVLAKAGPQVVATLEGMSREPEAQAYDKECDEFEQIKQEVTKEFGQNSLWEGSWGKLHTILEKARNLSP